MMMASGLKGYGISNANEINSSSVMLLVPVNGEPVDDVRDLG